MSEAQKQLLLWAGIILLLSYIMGFNVVSVIYGIAHGLQQVHQTNVHH